MRTLLQTLQNNGYPYSKRRIVLFLGLFLVLPLILFLLWPKPNFTKYSPTNTGLVARDNFGVMHGSEILGFNGMSFYKIDTTQDSSVTNLSKAAKLPKPLRVFWANEKGILVNFEESFIGTKVESALMQSGKSLSKFTELYTWYYDFSTGSIHQVSDAPLLANGAVYSAEDNGFYYMPDYSPFGPYEDLDYPVESTPLYFYSLANKTNELISTDLLLTDVSHIALCPNATKTVCILARDKSNARDKKLYSVNKSNMSVLLTSSGKLFPTNRPEYYIVAESTDKSTDEEVIDYTNMTIQLQHIVDKTFKDFDFRIGGDDIVTYIHDDGKFYMLNAHSDSEYRSGKIDKKRIRSRKYTLLNREGTKYTDRLTANTSYGSSGKMLMATQDNNQVLLIPEETNIVIPNASQKEAQDIVDTCTQQHAQQSDFASQLDMFRVFFTENNTLQTSISAFENCVGSRNKAILSSFNFYIGLLDARNGKITSD